MIVAILEQNIKFFMITICNFHYNWLRIISTNCGVLLMENMFW
jgi:hypothetical protein